MTRRTVHFNGHVQGVGFRYTAQTIAARFHVNGYVRNLPDGRVELVMEGSDDEMDAVIQAISGQMHHHVRKVQTQQSPATGEFVGFEIRH
jgi:acylphosphatase